MAEKGTDKRCLFKTLCGWREVGEMGGERLTEIKRSGVLVFPMSLT